MYLVSLIVLKYHLKKKWVKNIFQNKYLMCLFIFLRNSILQVRGDVL